MNAPATSSATDPAIAGDLLRIEELQDWLNQYLGLPLSVAFLARHAGINQNKLQRIFRTRFGSGVMSYVRARRLIRARYQLEATLTNIKTIAADAGYKRVSAFTHAFHQFHGLTPGQVCKTRRSLQPYHNHLPATYATKVYS